MNIEDLKNNPELNINVIELLMNVHSTNLMNSYYLKAILEKQIQIIKLQKGETGQELNSSVQAEIDLLDKKFSKWLKEDFISDVSKFSKD